MKMAFTQAVLTLKPEGDTITLEDLEEALEDVVGMYPDLIGPAVLVELKEGAIVFYC